MDFVGIMLGEFLFVRICCRNGDKFYGCRNFFASIEVFVDFVGILLGQILCERICCCNGD